MTSAFKTTVEKALVKSENKEGQDIQERVKLFLGKETTRREEWERKAYINMMMKEGHHWVNDQGVADARDPNQLRRHVNKFKSVGRGLKNSIVYNDPIVDILPDNGEQVDQRELDLASAILRNEFDMAGEEGEGMKDLLRTLVDEAAHKSFSMVSLMPNQEEDSPRINDITVHDSFDVFFDNHNLQKAQLVVVSSFEDREWLASEGFKDLPESNTDQLHSHSALKNAFDKAHDRFDPSMEHGSLLIDNVYYVDHKRDDEGEPTGKRKIMNIVLAGETVIRAPEEVKGYKHLGQLFFLYYMEKSKFVKYPTPWMSDLIPLQRSLNDSSENIDTILHWIAKVRLMQRAGAQNTIQLIGDRHVQKVRYEGERPSFMEFPAIPQDLFRQTQMREAQIEDMVGVHAASMGRSSGDRVSGRKEAVLSAGDADNVAEPVRNLETFLSRLFAQVLENAADNMTKVQKIAGQAGEVFEALGDASFKKMKDGKKKENIIPVKAFHNIRVTIMPGSNMLIAQSRQEVLQLLPVLLQNGMQEQSEALFEVFLRMYAVGMSRDIGKVVERKKNEFEAQNAELMVAKAEVDLLAEGKPVTATPEQPHELHVQLKMTALSTLMSKGIARKDNKDPIFTAFMRNIQQHQSMLQGGEPMGIETMIKGVK